MSGIINGLPEGGSYTLISNENLFPQNKSVKWINAANVIEEIHERFPFLEELWSRLIPQFKSEVIRFYWAIKGGNENSMYLDCDVEVHDWPELKADTFYLYPWSSRGATVDCNIFAVNGHTMWAKNFFIWYLEMLEKRVSRFPRVPYSLTFSHINKWVRKHSSGLFRLDIFDPTCFTHHRDAS